MTRETLQVLINDFSDQSPLNYLSCHTAVNSTSLSQEEIQQNNYARNNLYNRGTSFDPAGAEIPLELEGMRFFQQPIFSITGADNPGFAEIRKPGIVGCHHFLPEDWLTGAKSVISVFLPYEREIVESNKKDPIEPSMQWLCTRVEGQRFLLALGAEIRDQLISQGYRAVAPYTEDRYIMQVNTNPAPGTAHVPPYSTNWSERHVAVVAGLGTFGLSTNFISKAGSAGRLISIITDWETEPDDHDYDDWLGYCSRCGACVRRCPAQAHFKDKIGKDHSICGAFIRETCAKFEPRYGCGKCQSGIPCEYRPMRSKQ